LQQLVITVLLGIAFITLQWSALAKPGAAGLQLPTFDENSSFLWLLGLSHAAYLAYKAPTKKPA
jgi:heme/copper-type cytochrome/quinol oxidase subunit 3